MINLIPPDAHSDIVYARRNRMLLRWVAGVGAGLVVLALIFGVGLLYLSSSAQNQDKEIAITKQALIDNHLEETQKRIEDISGSLKLATNVLSREILFSKLVQQVGAIMPKDTTLTGLDIASVKGGIDLSAIAKDYKSGTQIQLNLVDQKNQLFDKADITQINCPTNGDKPSAYPCNVTIRALFKDNNQFMFLSKTNNGAKQ